MNNLFNVTKTTNNVIELSHFVYSQTYSWQEYANLAPSKIISKHLLVDYLKGFTNPASTIFIGEFFGLAAPTIALFHDTPVGGSGYKSDFGNLMNGLTKVAIKGSMIGLYIHYYPQSLKVKGGLDGVALYGNYIGDSVGGIFRQSSMDFQINKNIVEKDGFKYITLFLSEFKFEWISQSFLGGLPKTFASNNIGSVGKYIYEKSNTEELINSVLKFTNDFVNTLSGQENGRLAYLAVNTIDLISKFAMDFVVVIPTVAVVRSIQTVIEKINVNKILEKISEVSSFVYENLQLIDFQNHTPIAGETQEVSEEL